MPVQPTKGKSQVNVELPTDLLAKFRQFAKGRGERFSATLAHAMGDAMGMPPPLNEKHQEAEAEMKKFDGLKKPKLATADREAVFQKVKPAIAELRELGTRRQAMLTRPDVGQAGQRLRAKFDKHSLGTDLYAEADPLIAEVEKAAQWDQAEFSPGIMAMIAGKLYRLFGRGAAGRKHTA